MKCPKCGSVSKRKVVVKFCDQCGYQLDSPSKGKSTAIPPSIPTGFLKGLGEILELTGEYLKRKAKEKSKDGEGHA